MSEPTIGTTPVFCHGLYDLGDGMQRGIYESDDGQGGGKIFIAKVRPFTTAIPTDAVEISVDANEGFALCRAIMAGGRDEIARATAQLMGVGGGVETAVPALRILAAICMTKEPFASAAKQQKEDGKNG